MVKKAFKIGEAKSSESVLVGDEDATVIAVLDVVEELVEVVSVFIESAANVGVGGFDCPAVIVCVVSETVELSVKISVVFCP